MQGPRRFVLALSVLFALAPVTYAKEPPGDAAPEVRGVVRKLDRAHLGRSNAHEYVFFDVDWTFAEPLAKRSRVNGHVTLVDADGRARLKLPWPLARSPALGRHYSETGVGLALEDAGKAAAWLRTVSPDEVGIRYTPVHD